MNLKFIFVLLLLFVLLFSGCATSPSPTTGADKPPGGSGSPASPASPDGGEDLKEPFGKPPNLPD